MKKVILLALGIVFISSLIAQNTQIKVPKLSPFQKTETKIGIVDVTLEYSRPSMRGRAIFGELEPFGKVWRTGANKNTKITFNNYVIIGDAELPPGTYTIFTRPNPDTWDIYFHTLLDGYGVPDTMKFENIVAQVTVPTIELNRDIETLSITFDDLTANSAQLGIAWEQTYVSVLIEIPTEKIITNFFDDNQVALAKEYSVSAYIYFDLENDSNSALKAINKSINLREKEMSFEQRLKIEDPEDEGLVSAYSKKAEILIDLNNRKEALQYAEQALTLAKNINDEWWTAYITKNINEWSERLKD